MTLACGGSPCGPSSGNVTEVIDGDTITLSTGEKIRYLLVNAPEITNGHNDCYGKEAADFNRAQVLGNTVTLKYDDSGCTDRFGRLLAYVSVNGQEVNSQLVRKGFACVLFIPPPGTARKDEFFNLQDQAKLDGAGMWSACPAPPADCTAN